MTYCVSMDDTDDLILTLAVVKTYVVSNIEPWHYYMELSYWYNAFIIIWILFMNLLLVCQ